jgi:putative dimethyl sulfoxide reductase chaperone
MSSTSAISRVEFSHQANAFYSLAAAFRQPREWQKGDPLALQEHFGKFGGELAEYANEVTETWLAAVQNQEPCEVAFAKLFLGPFETMASPYASTYLDPAQKLMGQVSQYALDAYAAAGLEQVGKVREIPDHIGIELEFMYYLAFEISETGNEALLAIKERFWREHLGLWMPKFAALMQDANQHPFYNALAKLIDCFACSTMEEEVTVP